MNAPPTLTAIFVKNVDSDYYTAYVQEIPGVVAQGLDVDEAELKLMNALKVVLQYKRGDSLEDSLPDSAVKKSFTIQAQ